MKEELKMSLDPRTADVTANADNASLLESKTSGVIAGDVSTFYLIITISKLESC